MPHFRDWKELAGSTVRSLQKEDMASLYSLEWHEVLRALTTDHRAKIEGETRKPLRYVRIFTAVLYGLAVRLAPHRRALFAIGWLAGLMSLVSILSGWDAGTPSFRTMFGLVFSFVVLTLLIGLELIDKLKYRDELELARDLQASLVPRDLPKLPNLELEAWNRIANTVGGDLYDFITLPDGRVAVIFGDASGHGMAAGLVMAVAHAAFRTQLDVDPDPRMTMQTLNRILCRTGGTRSFFTCCYLLMEPDGRFRAAVAGHPPILQLGSGGEVVRRIGRGSYPLGIRDTMTVHVDEGTLQQGETLLLYSDGLVEAMSPSEEVFGYDRVERIIRHRPEMTAPRLVSTLVANWTAHVEGRRVEDDISIVALRRELPLPPLPRFSPVSAPAPRARPSGPVIGRV